MTRRMRIVAQVVGVLLILAFLYPPWNRTGSGSSSVKWAFLWSAALWGIKGISWGPLFLEMAIIAVIGGLVFVSLKDKRP